MRIVRRPWHHIGLSFLVLLSIPIFALNIWVLHKGSIRLLFEPQKLHWMIGQAVCTVLILQGLLAVRWRGVWLFVAMSIAMIGANFYFLSKDKNYALAFYALFLVIMAGLYIYHLYKSLSEVYYHPGKKWYEGLPRFIPKVEAEISTGGSTHIVSARLSRLAHEGCWVYPHEVSDLKKPKSVVLKLGDFKLDCAVELISKTKDGKGRGLRFVAQSADVKKEINDFIERVRSCGYVS